MKKLPEKSYRHFLITALLGLVSAMLVACANTPEKAASNRWQVEPTQSSLYLVTTKKQHIAEVMRIPGLSGHYDGQRLELHIDLRQIDSGIPIRDQRMREHLFETRQYPQAIVSAEITPETLSPGQHTVNFTLDLHGAQHSYSATIWVSRLDNDHLLVSLSQPVLIAAGDFGLEAGIETLARLAGLPHISHSVPVTASLVLVPQSP